MACHNKFGTISNLRKGIYNSCNTYFAKTYKMIIDKYDSPSLGLDSWSKHIKSFGLGDYLGYDLSIGKKGFIPESNYYIDFMVIIDGVPQQQYQILLVKVKF